MRILKFMIFFLIIFFYFSIYIKMTGGATQLSISGGQDKYLHYMAVSGFFDAQHYSYEDFAIESIEVTSSGQVDFARTARFKLMNSAELISGAYIEVTMPEITATTDAGGVYYKVAWVHSLGIYLFEEIEFIVNSTRVDVHYPEYLDMWTRLCVPESKRKGFNDMIGETNVHRRIGFNHVIYEDQVDSKAPQIIGDTKPEFKMAVPLRFWFCESYSQALPIGILLFSEVYIDVKFNTFANLYIQYENDTSNDFDAGTTSVSTSTITKPTLADAKLYVDYVFLNQRARNRIASKSLFYVINQVKTNGAVTVSGSTYSYRLPFVMPVSELLFGVRETDATTDKQYHIWDRYTDNKGSITDDTIKFNLPDTVVSTAELKLLNDKRFEVRDYLYWSRYQQLRHHTSIPETRGIWSFSFSLWPEKSSASGAANFSSSDNNYLNLVFNQSAGINGGTSGIGVGGKTGALYVFAKNYNYVFIDGGYFTLLYNA
jgi:hypothetical protein